MESNGTKAVSVLILMAAIVFVVRNDGCTIPNPLPAPAPAIERATYVYEKDDGGVPPGVAYVLREANKAGKIVGSVIEDDIVDSTGNTPPQFAVAVSAAKEAGLPALVLESSEGVVKVLQSPDEQQVTEALP